MKKILLGLLTLPAVAFANQEVGVAKSKFWNFSLGFQNKTMDTREIVYKESTGDTRLSELDWRIDNAKMFGGEIELTPTDRWSFKLGAYKNIGDNTTTMDDYDWLDYSTGTGDDDYDKHTSSRAELDYATDINFDISYKFYDGQNNDFFVLAGIDYMHTKWSTYGYDGVYTQQNYESQPGTTYPVHLSDSVMGLSYEQSQLVGYIGLGYEFSYKKVNLGVSGKKGIGTTKSTDEHIMRSITFEDEMDASYISTSIYAKYNFTEDFSGKLEYIYEFSENDGHGDEMLKDNQTGKSEDFNDGVGFENESSIIRASLAYYF